MDDLPRFHVDNLDEDSPAPRFIAGYALSICEGVNALRFAIGVVAEMTRELGAEDPEHARSVTRARGEGQEIMPTQSRSGAGGRNRRRRRG